MKSIEEMMSELTEEEKKKILEIANQDCTVSYEHKDGEKSVKMKGHPANITNAVCEIIHSFVMNTTDWPNKYVFLNVIKEECEEHLRKVNGESDGK